ncbi:MAG: hypothetical protein BMS9Abin34_278 [Patescibacteria group bacterium]|nr:MAG: hypothetical protein BMS9Abin34_278 [Patescibacteria group bacterium]
MKRPALVSFFSSGKILLLILAVMSIFLVQRFFKVGAREDQLGSLRSEVGALRMKVDEKLGELEYRRSPEFVYKVALEQLGYARPGEVIVVLPDFEDEQSSSSGASAKEGGEKDSPKSSVGAEPLPYWKQWRVLFLGN